MDAARLQDVISRGMGVAARRAGVQCDAFRPDGPDDPLAPERRFLRLPAAFNAEDPRFQRAQAYGRPVWYGVFDAAYTRPGDYLVESGGARTWFIAMQPSLLPVVCVLTNRVVRFARAAAPDRAGVNGYGGLDRARTEPLLTDWPASVLGTGAGERPAAGVPGETRLASCIVLMPAADPVLLRVDDVMTDDLGRRFTVGSAELSELGWRLAVRQVAA